MYFSLPRLHFYIWGKVFFCRQNIWFYGIHKVYSKCKLIAQILCEYSDLFHRIFKIKYLYYAFNPYIIWQIIAEIMPKFAPKVRFFDRSRAIKHSRLRWTQTALQKLRLLPKIVSCVLVFSKINFWGYYFKNYLLVFATIWTIDKDHIFRNNVTQ